LGWAVGEYGTILHTEDGGGSWKPQSSSTYKNLFSVGLATPQSGWAVGEYGTILHTEDGGGSWKPQSSSTSQLLSSIAFATPQSGWAVGDGGTIVHTEDAGDSWTLQNSGTSPWLSSVAFATPQSGWAVGLEGTILHTENGGGTWKPQNSGTTADFYSVAFATPQSGWAVGGDGTILHTENGGGTWKPQSSGMNVLGLSRSTSPSNGLFSVAFVTPRSGWVAGDGGTILHTEDGGGSWKPQRSGPHRAFLSVAFATTQSGWVTGWISMNLHTEDGGGSWKLQNSGTVELLSSIAFATPQSGWAVGDGGTIVHTENGGASWKPQSSGTSQPLFSVAFATPQSGWAVGQGGTILHTEDGGTSWKRQGYRPWPAPWFLFVLTCCVAGLIWASSPLAPTGDQPYIEDLANADSPVAQLKYDVLGYKPLVTRLLRFIQNPKTRPPLVLAIQAAWGMGKSSVMAMLQTELQDKRAAITVWFNAWHHQKEDQLLAYLLEAIQKQVAPSWFSPVGLGFRFNLLRVRMFSSPERFLATVAALALLVFHSGIASGLARVTAVSDFLKQHPNWQPMGPLTLAVLAVLVIVNQLRAFTSDPQKLLQESSQTLWRFVRDLLVFPSLQGKTDVRQEFAKDLKEVTDALLPQRLVIFLDDLDRCRPEQVVQILEAINFLGSAAPCFIILGADYRKVETLAGQHFEAIAVQEAENVALDNSTDAPNHSAPAATRLEYAKNYMRKIVNMRLDLPHPTPKGYADLIRQVGESGSNARTRLQQAVVGILLLLFVTSSIAVSAGWLELPFCRPQQGQIITSQRALPPEFVKGTTGPALEQPEKPVATPAPKVEKPSTIVEIDRDRIGVLWNHRLTIAVPLVIALFFLVRLLRRPKEMEKAVDSKSFTDALGKMAPAIQQRCGTPREVRRFQNYLRFLAAWDDSAARPQVADLEADLVELAATGIRMKDGKDRTDIPRNVIDFFSRQCDMLGLDPNTFRPSEERNTRARVSAASSS
jgi:photosystem II stability/assembly factor-like uncharacterized protein